MRTFLAAIVLLLAACAPQAAGQATQGGQLQVVAANSIIADVVTQVGGEHIALSVLVPAGADPHAFEATPQDAAKLEGATLVFVNGLGLEESIESVLAQANADGKVVVVSQDLDLLAFEEHAEGEHEHKAEHEDEHEGEHEHQGEHHHHSGQGPHVWMDPHNVQTWSHVISVALSQADPAHAAEYQANAASYQAQLKELDGWIAQQVAAIPLEQRQLVTDHESFNYFARRYQFEIVGVLIPSFSSLSEVSAGELATLEQNLSSHAVPAIFIASSINPSLAERIADDIGVQLVTLYAESLSEAQGPAPSYLQMMRYNVSAIVDALR